MVNMNTTKNGRQTLSDHRTTVKRSPPIGFTGKAKSRKAHPPCGRTFPAPVEDEKDFSQKAHPPPTPAHLLCASHGVTGDVLRRAAGRVDLQKSAFLTQCCCFFSLCCFHSVNEGRLHLFLRFKEGLGFRTIWSCGHLARVRTRTFCAFV